MTASSQPIPLVARVAAAAPELATPVGDRTTVEFRDVHRVFGAMSALTGLSLRIEPDRVRPGIGLDRLDKPHPFRIHDIDHAGITYRHVEMAQLGIEKDHIGRTAQR